MWTPNSLRRRLVAVPAVIVFGGAAIAGCDSSGSSIAASRAAEQSAAKAAETQFNTVTLPADRQAAKVEAAMNRQRTIANKLRIIVQAACAVPIHSENSPLSAAASIDVVERDSLDEVYANNLVLHSTTKLPSSLEEAQAKQPVKTGGCPDEPGLKDAINAARKSTTGRAAQSRQEHADRLLYGSFAPDAEHIRLVLPGVKLEPGAPLVAVASAACTLQPAARYPHPDFTAEQLAHYRTFLETDFENFTDSQGMSFAQLVAKCPNYDSISPASYVSWAALQFGSTAG